MHWLALCLAAGMAGFYLLFGAFLIGRCLWSLLHFAGMRRRG